MAVTSTTLAGVNVWQFSGAVTDAELKTAWAALITNGVYVINRAIYLDNTADLTGCSGGFLVDFGTQVSPAFILHTGRDKTKSTFKNFTFLQRTGLVVVDRGRFVMTWNGTALGTPVGADGLSQNGGGMIYGVPGNPGGGDPRFLNEMSFAGLEGATVYSQEFTEQELQIVVGQTSVMRGISFEKCFGFPQIGTPTGNVNVVVYRSSQNTQHPTQQPIRLFPDSGRWAAACYVDSFVTRNNAVITTNLGAFFSSSATNRANVMVANNYLDEKWFGAAKTAMATMGNWNAANNFIGVVFKKLQFVGGDGATIRAYDSRSTTAAQKCEFKESGFFDFLSTNLAPTTDSEGKIWMVHVGAIATGAGPSPAITRYTNQRFTFQKFGFRVSVTDIDMTQGGDNDLSAFTPVIPVAQDGLVRTQAAINAATTINSFQDLLEELHVLAIGLSGSASYAGAHSGNLFTYSGGVLTTSFASVTVDPTATAKISYNSATNTLIVKSSIMTSTVDVSKWVNNGTITLANGAAIQGVYQSSAGTSTTWEFQELALGNDSACAVWDSSGNTLLYVRDPASATQRLYLPPGSTLGTLTYGVAKYGKRFEYGTFPANAGGVLFYVPDYQDDVGITEPTLATVEVYTAIDTSSKFYDRAGAFKLTEQGIKLGDIAVRSGTAIETGSYSILVKQNASSVFGVVGSLITIKSTSFAGDSKYSSIIATAPATVTADTNEVITIDIEDANGNSSVTLNGGDGTFELWKIPTSTATNDYATGTLLDTVGNEKYRFIGIAGFDMVGVDINSNIRRRISMAKGVYTMAFYVGDQIQLAQAPQVIENGIKLDVLQVDLDALIADIEAIKGSGFTTLKNSLVSLRKHVTNSSQF